MGNLEVRLELPLIQLFDHTWRAGNSVVKIRAADRQYFSAKFEPENEHAQAISLMIIGVMEWCKLLIKYFALGFEPRALCRTIMI